MKYEKEVKDSVISDPDFKSKLQVSSFSNVLFHVYITFHPYEATSLSFDDIFFDNMMFIILGNLNRVERRVACPVDRSEYLKFQHGASQGFFLGGYFYHYIA